MKQERGTCHKCGKRSAVRDGEATDGRPRYQCINGFCKESWTNGFTGEPWDTSPRVAKK